jgi:hypothetical protein
VVDGTNRRIGKKVNGTLVQGFLYEGWLRPVAELDGSGNVVSRFVYATRLNVPDYMEKGGKTYRIITDRMGSARLVVDASTGKVAQRIDYDEFGNVLENTNTGFQLFGFAGGLYDADTKLVRFGVWWRFRKCPISCVLVRPRSNGGAAVPSVPNAEWRITTPSVARGPPGN